MNFPILHVLAHFWDKFWDVERVKKVEKGVQKGPKGTLKKVGKVLEKYKNITKWSK